MDDAELQRLVNAVVTALAVTSTQAAPAPPVPAPEHTESAQPWQDLREEQRQTRASLAQDGGASLGELLQRSGIDLGGVSVGAQGQQTGQDQPARAPQGTGTPAAQRGREADSPAASAAQPPRPRADGSSPLDLFV